MEFFDSMNCPKENHDDIIHMICSDPSCIQDRLICTDCLPSHSHNNSHILKIKKYLPQQIELCSQYNNKIQNEIIEIQCKVQSAFSLFLKALNCKYNVSAEMLRRMKNFQSINEAVCFIVSFGYRKNILFETLQFRANSLVEELKFLEKELKLGENTYIKDVETFLKESAFLSQRANYLIKSQKEEAQQCLEQALKLNPNNIEAINIQSNLLFKVDNILAAQEMNQKALQINSYNPEALLLKIKLQNFQQKKQSVKNIINHIDKISKFSSFENQILYEKAQILFKNDHYNEALSIYDEIQIIDEFYIDQIYEKGQQLRKMGNYEESQKWFEKILSIDNKHMTSINVIGQVLIRQKKYQEALNYYENCLNQFQKDDDLIIGKCEALYYLNLREEALIFYQNNPTRKYIQTIIQHSQELYDKNQYDEALRWSAALVMSKNMDDSPYRFITSMALNLFKQSKYKQCEPWFRQALQLKSEIQIGYHYLITLLKQEKHQECLNFFCKWIEINPKDVDNFLHIADDLFQNQQYEESLKWYQKVKEKRMDISEKLEKFGQQLFQKGMYHESSKWYYEAARHNKQHYIKIILDLAKQLELKKSSGEAQRWYNIALSINPNNEKAKEGSKRVTKYVKN